MFLDPGGNKKRRKRGLLSDCLLNYCIINYYLSHTLLPGQALLRQKTREYFFLLAELRGGIKILFHTHNKQLKSMHLFLCIYFNENNKGWI